MKSVILALLVLLSMATGATASDSLAAGIRIGTVSNKSSGQYYEAFGDLYLNNLISIGATASYYLVDHNSLGSVKRDEAMPVTALFKVHAPIPYIKPYAGLGQAIVFHNKESAPDRRWRSSGPVSARCRCRSSSILNTGISSTGSWIF